jgi:hypothetical protein
MLVFVSVLHHSLLAVRALDGNYTVWQFSFLRFLLILNLNQVAADTGSSMLRFIRDGDDLLAELAFHARVLAFKGIVLEFFLFLEFVSAALTDDFEVLAFVELMSAEY